MNLIKQTLFVTTEFFSTLISEIMFLQTIDFRKKKTDLTQGNYSQPIPVYAPVHNRNR
jgi:hypothetical protein